MDLGQHALARGELRRFADRFTPAALLDTSARAYRTAGLQYLSFEGDGLFERLLADQQLLVLPLVRSGAVLAVGVDERTWQLMLPAGGRLA